MRLRCCDSSLLRLRSSSDGPTLHDHFRQPSYCRLLLASPAVRMRLCARLGLSRVSRADDTAGTEPRMFPQMVLRAQASRRADLPPWQLITHVLQ